MSQLGCSDPASPTNKGTSSGDAAHPVDGGASPCPPPCSCSISLSPNPLEIYVSEPHVTLTANAQPGGGKFVWTSSDSSKLKITGSGSAVTVKGLDEGDITVTVNYTPPGCGGCSANATVKVRYEVRHILFAQGIQFNNAQLANGPGIVNRGDFQIPGGYLFDQLKAATPFPMELSGSNAATFKSVKQGVKFTIEVITSRIDFKKGLERDGKPGTKELEYWHVLYDGHSRYGRGTCFGTSDAKGEDWENSQAPHTAPNGIYRMGYPFVGVPVAEILHKGYSTDVVSIKVDPSPKDREYKGRLHPKTLSDIKSETAAFLEAAIKNKTTVSALEMSEDSARECLADMDKLDTRLRIVGDSVALGNLGAPLKPADQFWGYHTGEGPLVLLQAGWQQTVCNPMDLGATDLKCRMFCHLGCESFMHYRAILRFDKGWKKKGSTDRLAYFTNDISVSIVGPFLLYYWLTYDQFNAGKPWEPSIEYARTKTNAKIKSFCFNYNRSHRYPVRVFEVW